MGKMGRFSVPGIAGQVNRPPEHWATGGAAGRVGGKHPVILPTGPLPVEDALPQVTATSTWTFVSKIQDPPPNAHSKTTCHSRQSSRKLQHPLPSSTPVAALTVCPRAPQCWQTAKEREEEEERGQ